MPTITAGAHAPLGVPAGPRLQNTRGHPHTDSKTHSPVCVLSAGEGFWVNKLLPAGVLPISGSVPTVGALSLMHFYFHDSFMELQPTSNSLTHTVQFSGC